jgi:type IV pilus assembly protein PilC
LAYKNLLGEVANSLKSGLILSEAFGKFPEQIPKIFMQMVQVGEETGSMGSILKNLTDFYEREVGSAIDTLVGLIEPVMIVVLGFGVGILLVSVLMPIYNMAGSIS